jgi:hypothetical protein
MHTIAMAVDLGVIEKLREEELEEARSIQSGMLPVCETHPHSAPPMLLGYVFSEVERFTRGRTQHDDMAAAVFRCCVDETPT